MPDRVATRGATATGEAAAISEATAMREHTPAAHAGGPDPGPVARLSRLCLALASPTRLCLLKLVETEELCVCELAEMLGVSQPAVTQHLAKLKAAGLVSLRRLGQMILVRAGDVASLLEGELRCFTRPPAATLPELRSCLERSVAARGRRRRDGSCGALADQVSTGRDGR